VPYVVTYKKLADRVRNTIGLDRVLFGSDYPAVGGATIKSMVDEVKGSNHLTEEEKAKILGLNAVELLGLK